VKSLTLPRLLDDTTNTKIKDEKDFRSFYLKQDINLAKKAMILFAIPILGFSVNDYIFFGFSNLFFSLVVVRTFLLIVIGLEIVQ
jgi:hypothetical protein